MAQGNAASALAGAGKFTELRQRLLFVLGALVVYRIGCFVPVPGVNPDAMLAMMQAQGGGIVDMFNMFSGGALHRFSIFALNVMPYISASIVMQLAVHIFPSLKAMQKEGESGRRKITQYSRIGAVLLAVVQGGSIATALQNQVAPGGMPVVYAPGMGFVLTAVVALTMRHHLPDVAGRAGDRARHRQRRVADHLHAASSPGCRARSSRPSAPSATAR